MLHKINTELIQGSKTCLKVYVQYVSLNFAKKSMHFLKNRLNIFLLKTPFLL